MNVYDQLCKHKALCIKLGGQDGEDLFQEAILKYLECKSIILDPDKYFKTIITRLKQHRSSNYSKLRGKEWIINNPEGFTEPVASCSYDIMEKIDSMPNFVDRFIMNQVICRDQWEECDPNQRKGTIKEIHRKTTISRPVITTILKRCREQLTA